MGDGPPGPELRALRDEIARIDRALVSLIAARVSAARRAIRLRTDQGGAPTDPSQEARVLERARRWARHAGLPPELVVEILTDLVAEGKEGPRADAPKSPAVPAPVPRRRGPRPPRETDRADG